MATLEEIRNALARQEVAINRVSDAIDDIFALVSSQDLTVRKAVQAVKAIEDRQAEVVEQFREYRTLHDSQNGAGVGNGYRPL